MAASSGAGLRLPSPWCWCRYTWAALAPCVHRALRLWLYLRPSLTARCFKNTFGSAVATPTDKRGFVTPKFWGLVRPHRSPLVLGGMAEAVTPGARLNPCF